MKKFVIKHNTGVGYWKGAKASCVIVRSLSQASRFETSKKAQDLLDFWASCKYPVYQWTIVEVAL